MRTTSSAQYESKRFQVMFASAAQRDRDLIPASKSVSSGVRNESHGRAPGSQAFGEAFVAHRDNRSSFQQVPKPVPWSAADEVEGTPVSFTLNRKAGPWKSDETGTEQPCIQRPTTAGSGGLPSLSTNRRAPPIQ